MIMFSTKSTQRNYVCMAGTGSLFLPILVVPAWRYNITTRLGKLCFGLCQMLFCLGANLSHLFPTPPVFSHPKQDLHSYNWYFLVWHESRNATLLQAHYPYCNTTPTSTFERLAHIIVLEALCKLYNLSCFQPWTRASILLDCVQQKVGQVGVWRTREPKCCKVGLGVNHRPEEEI